MDTGVQSPSPQKLPSKIHWIFWLLLLGSLAPWFVVRWGLTTHADILWLSESMLRLLDGGSMATTAYETNPPLSVLLYAIPALLQKYAGLPLHITTLVQAFAVLGVCTAMLMRVLKSFDALSDGLRLSVIVGYLVSNTILSAFHFGERDHLIGMALVPFMLLQVTITRRLRMVQAADKGFMTLAAALFLLKPHFGLLPVVMLSLRVMKRRAVLPVLRDPDFVILTLVTLAYAAVLWFGFRDYLEIILPDMIRYYLMSSENDKLVTIVAMGTILIGAVYTCTFGMKAGEGAQKICRSLLLSCVPCLIAAALQDKAYYYHYLPAIIFFCSAASMLVYDAIAAKLERPVAVLLGWVAAMAMLAYLAVPLQTERVKHEEFASLPLAQEITAATAGMERPSFFMFSNRMGMMHELAYYTGTTHGSRFPGLWFLPGLYYYEQEKQLGLLGPDDVARLTEDYQHYGDMLAEDLERYKPAVVWIISPEIFDGKMDLLKFFSRHEHFNRAWAHYTFDRDVKIDRGLYADGPLDAPPVPFSVYRRLPDAR